MREDEKLDATVVGRNIARLRREKGMKQQVLADILGVTNKTISKWECGRGLPDIAQFPKIAEVFGVSREKLVTDDSVESLPAPASSKKRKVLFVVAAAVAILIVAGIVTVAVVSSRDNGYVPTPPPVATDYDIDGEGSFTFEAEKSELSENLFVQTDGGSGRGYVGNFDYHDGAALTFRFTAKSECFAGLYFCLSPRGINDICTETYTVELNGTSLSSRTVFRDADHGWTYFTEYFIVGIDLACGNNVLKIVFNANESNNNGHNFDYVRIDTRYVAPTEDILEAEECEFDRGLLTYYDAGSGLGYLGQFDTNDGATMKFRYNAAEQCERLLYICCSPRGRYDLISQTYNITVNGTKIVSNGIIYGAFTSWTDFREYLVGNIALQQGENLIEFRFNLDAEHPNNGHNFDYIRFAEYKVKQLKNEGTTVLEAEESLYDSRLQPVIAGETVYLGNFDIADGASMTYVFRSPTHCEADLTLRCVPRGYNEKIDDTFEIKVNGKTFTSTEIISGDFVSWTAFETYKVGKIQLAEGINEIIITFHANESHNNGHNFDYIGLIVGREK